MKKYVISYLGIWETDIQMTQVEAISELEALYEAAYYFGFELPRKAEDVEDFKYMCLDNKDCIIEVLEVK